MRRSQALAVSMGLLILALPGFAGRHTPDRLLLPSVRLVGIDHAGVAQLITSFIGLPVQRAILPPPEVSKPPIRRLYFRTRPGSQTASPAAGRPSPRHG